jgi:hypothetical protein
MLLKVHDFPKKLLRGTKLWGAVSLQTQRGQSTFRAAAGLPGPSAHPGNFTISSRRATAQARAGTRTAEPREGSRTLTSPQIHKPLRRGPPACQLPPACPPGVSPPQPSGRRGTIKAGAVERSSKCGARRPAVAVRLGDVPSSQLLTDPARMAAPGPHGYSSLAGNSESGRAGERPRPMLPGARGRTVGRLPLRCDLSPTGTASVSAAPPLLPPRGAARLGRTAGVGAGSGARAVPEPPASRADSPA